MISFWSGLLRNLEQGKAAVTPILFCKTFYTRTHYILDLKDDERYIAVMILAGFPPIPRRTA
ncbi:MAG: hypothetical protein KA419_07495 [Acidobacteria bacterium]|nr:hypothetical protein [Acidobacteriota bacterium]